MKGLVNDPKIMFNETFVRFEPYCAVVMVNLLTLLEDIANRIFEIVEVVPKNIPYTNFPGLSVLLEWINNYQ